MKRILTAALIAGVALTACGGSSALDTEAKHTSRKASVTEPPRSDDEAFIAEMREHRMFDTWSDSDILEAADATCGVIDDEGSVLAANRSMYASLSADGAPTYVLDALPYLIEASIYYFCPEYGSELE